MTPPGQGRLRPGRRAGGRKAARCNCPGCAVRRLRTQACLVSAPEADLPQGRRPVSERRNGCAGPPDRRCAVQGRPVPCRSAPGRGRGHRASGSCAVGNVQEDNAGDDDVERPAEAGKPARIRLDMADAQHSSLSEDVAEVESCTARASQERVILQALSDTMAETGPPLQDGQVVGGSSPTAGR